MQGFSRHTRRIDIDFGSVTIYLRWNALEFDLGASFANQMQFFALYFVAQKLDDLWWLELLLQRLVFLVGVSSRVNLPWHLVVELVSRLERNLAEGFAVTDQSFLQIVAYL